MTVLRINNNNNNNNAPVRPPPPARPPVRPLTRAIRRKNEFILELIRIVTVLHEAFQRADEEAFRDTLNQAVSDANRLSRESDDESANIAIVSAYILSDREFDRRCRAIAALVLDINEISEAYILRDYLLRETGTDFLPRRMRDAYEGARSYLMRPFYLDV